MFFLTLSSAWHSEDPSVHYPLCVGLERQCGGACTGRLNSPGLDLFSGCESEQKKPSDMHET